MICAWLSPFEMPWPIFRAVHGDYRLKMSKICNESMTVQCEVSLNQPTWKCPVQKWTCFCVKKLISKLPLKRCQKRGDILWGDMEEVEVEVEVEVEEVGGSGKIHEEIGDDYRQSQLSKLSRIFLGCFFSMVKPENIWYLGKYFHLE